MIDHAVYSEEAKCFISSKLQRLGEILLDYDPYLTLRWIPPVGRTSDDSLPYCVVHDAPGAKPYVVKYFGELDDPEDILAQIFAGDNKNQSVLDKLEKKNAAAEAFRMKEQLDAEMEAADMFHFLMTSRSKNWVKWKDRSTGEVIKLDSDRRRV